MFGSSSAIRIFFVVTCLLLALAPTGLGCLARRHGGGHRQREIETRALAGAALGPDPAAEALDDMAADMQAETGALRLGGQSIAALAEFVENRRLVLGTDAGPVVAYADAQACFLHR